MAVSSPWYLSATPLTVRPWLIRLSAVTALLDAVVVAVAVSLPGADFPLRQSAAMVAVSGLANALMALALWRGRTVPAPLAVLALLVEVVLLAWLLDLTGGPFNPFAVVFGVYVALAGVALGRGPATVVAAAAAVAYGGCSTCTLSRTSRSTIGSTTFRRTSSRCGWPWPRPRNSPPISPCRRRHALDVMRRRAMQIGAAHVADHARCRGRPRTLHAFGHHRRRRP